MTPKFASAAGLIVASLLMGCLDSNDSTLDNDPGDDLVNNIESNPDETSAPAPGVDPESGPQALTKYNGDYLLGCTLSDSNTFYTLEMNVLDDVWTTIRTNYSDADCTTPTAVIQNSLSVIYPGGTTVTDQGTADHIDITPESVELNGEPVIDEAINRTAYSLVFLDDSGFYGCDFDDVYDGTTPENRSVVLDLDAIAIRQ